MNFNDLIVRAANHWRDALEIALLAVGIYYSWLLLRGTRGARILTTLAVFFLSIMLLAQVLDLRVIGWLFHNLSAFLVFALVVLFQPEIRRAMAAFGSHRLLSFVRESPPAVEVLAATTFDLANRQLGALIAVERDSSLDDFVESGVPIDAVISQELLVTFFFPKTPLHDGGVIIRGDRIVSAASIFPVSQRSDLDRNLGLRHRAGLGLSEEYDALVIVVSEETGIVSICQKGAIERNFDPETFKKRLYELLAVAPEPPHETPVSRSLAREDRVSRSRRHSVADHPKEPGDDRLAF
jgi:diadenylate cyclase